VIVPKLIDVLLVLAVAAIAAGAGLIYFPAGLIVAGVLTAAIVLAAERGATAPSERGR
jgi:hypothetical protein